MFPQAAQIHERFQASLRRKKTVRLYRNALIARKTKTRNPTKTVAIQSPPVSSLLLNLAPPYRPTPVETINVRMPTPTHPDPNLSGGAARLAKSVMLTSVVSVVVPPTEPDMIVTPPGP